MERFSTSVSIKELKAKAKNTKTTKSPCQWLRVYLYLVRLRKKSMKLSLEASRLGKIMQQFYAEVKRKDGTGYEPSSLANMQAAIDRGLREAGYMYSLLTSRHFLNSRNVLEGEARLLSEQGQSPNKKHEGFTYVTFSTGITKTRQYRLHETHRLQIPRMFETRNDRCPEKIFRTYLAERLAYFRTKGPFYLAVIYNPSCAIWFKRSPMGVHATENIKNVKSKSLLETSKHITSHLARKTLLKRLKQNNVGNSEIKSITGHSTAVGFYPYDNGDEKQKLAISNAIDNCSVKPISHRQHFIPTNDPPVLNTIFGMQTFNKIYFRYMFQLIWVTAIFKYIKIHQL